MRFILGRSGTGKTTKCFNEIKDNLNNEFDKPMYYIVPEQFSFEAEKKLIDVIGKNGIMGVQVLSFKRLAYKAFTDNDVVVNPLTDSAKSMLVYFIMLKLESEMQVLKGVSKNSGLVKTVVDDISEFKRYNVTPDMLEGIKTKSEYLNMKIHDLSTIYAEYERRLSSSYIDSNDELTILASVLEKDKSLDGSKIWIDEFDGFIPQELEIIRQLDKKCDVTVSMIVGENDFFELNNSNYQKLQNISKEHDENQKGSNIVLKDTFRFNSEELRCLEKRLFDSSALPYEGNCNSIYISDFQNAYEEVESISKEILKIVKTDRYENIAILTRNIEQYKNIFKMIFGLYDIPYFFDDKKSFSLEPVITLITSFIDIVINNYKYENVFSYLRTGLVNVEDINDVDILENYVLKYGIKGKKWLQDFTIEDVNLEKINLVRDRIISPIEKFKSNFSGRKTVKQVVLGLFEFLKDINVMDSIHKKILYLQNLNEVESTRISMEYAQVWNSLMSIFDEMVSVIGDEQISFDRFKQVFKIGIQNQEISVIPTTKDKVIIGDIERTRNSDIKYLFVVGACDGNFPRVMSSEGFINDVERQELMNNGIELAKDTKKLLTQEYFNIYKAFCVPKDRLYISYPTSDLEGRALRESIILNDIKKIFTNISKMDTNNLIFSKSATFPNMLKQYRNELDNGTSDEVYDTVRKWYELNEKEKYDNVIQGINYKNTIENQSKEVSDMLYGKDLKTSVSRLESFMLCPYSYYLNYGLKLKEREIFKLGVPDIGSFLHEIIEKFSKKVIEENINIRDLDKVVCDSMVEEIANDVIQSFRNNLFASTGKLRKLGFKLQELVKKMIWLIVYHIKAGEFNIAGSEVEFGKGKEYPEIIIEVNENHRMILSR